MNLEETKIPSVCIPCLNDYDGYDWFENDATPASKTSLGRQPTKHTPWKTELIKSIS